MWLRPLLAAVTVFALACGVTPVPDPPNALPPPEPGDVVMDGSGSTTELVGTGLGEPGSELRVFRLDRLEEARRVSVDAAGSFRFPLTGVDLGEELRMSSHDGERRSTPVDVLFVDGPRFEPSTRGLSCLTLAPDVQLDLGEIAVGEPAMGRVEIRNDCLDPVDLEASARTPEPGVAIDAVPASLAPGATGDLVVRLSAEAAGELERIVFVEVTSPVSDRRPLTLFGRAR